MRVDYSEGTSGVATWPFELALTGIVTGIPEASRSTAGSAAEGGSVVMHRGR